MDHLQSLLRAHQDSGSRVKFKLDAPSRATLMEWLTNAWDRLSPATLTSGFRKLAIPTDTRELLVVHPVLKEAAIAGLVDKLEHLHIAEEVGDDCGLKFSL